MKTAILIALIPIALLAAAPEASAQTKMTKSFWVYSGTKFRRTGAESAYLGSAGVVRKTVLKAYDFDRKESFDKNLFGPGVEIKVRKPTRVSGTSVNQFAKDSAVRYLTLSVSDTISQIRAGDLDLVKIEVSSEGDLVRAINRSPRYLDRLRKITPKRNLRVVTAIWVVVKAKEYADFKATANGKLTYAGLTVEGKHAGASKSAWKIKRGTIFAYEFAKVRWNKGRKQIESLKVDKPNM